MNQISGELGVCPDIGLNLNIGYILKVRQQDKKVRKSRKLLQNYG